MISFETSVRIDRPIEQVFAFVSDPIQFAQWNSAVQAVRRTSAVRGASGVRGASAETGEPGSTYSIERELPGGRVENGLKVFVHEQPTEFGIRATSGPTPFVYDYRFASDGEDTIVHLDAASSWRGSQPCLGRSRRARSGAASTRTSPPSSASLRQMPELRGGLWRGDQAGHDQPRLQDLDNLRANATPRTTWIARTPGRNPPH